MIFNTLTFNYQINMFYQSKKIKNKYHQSFMYKIFGFYEFNFYYCWVDQNFCEYWQCSCNDFADDSSDEFANGFDVVADVLSGCYANDESYDCEEDADWQTQDADDELDDYCDYDLDWCIDVHDWVGFGDGGYALGWHDASDGNADCGFEHFDVVCLLDLSLCVHSTALMNVMILVGLTLWIKIISLMVFIVVEAVLFEVSFWWVFGPFW